MTMFHEVRFPPDISYGAVGGPIFSTGVVTSMSGGEQRAQNWAMSRLKYDVSHGVKTKEQLDKLIAFFRARKGKAYGFRFKDWADYQADNQPCARVSVNPWRYQLQKQYVDDSGYTDLRTIKKPVAGTVKLYLDDSWIDAGYSVDYATGIVTFAADPGEAAVTASFEFDTPMRFDSDEMPISMENYDVYSWGNINVIEIDKA